MRSAHVAHRATATENFSKRARRPQGDGYRKARVGPAALLFGARFLVCNGRHSQEFYWADALFCKCQVLVFYFSFEITAARLNLCDGPVLNLEIDPFECRRNLHFEFNFFRQRDPSNSYFDVWMIL